MNTKILLVHALSPLHAGTGQSVGAVDLPTARDRATGFPYLPGSGLKGSLRGKSVELKRADTEKVFGPDTNHASDYAGSLAVGDAKLLLLPVRSVSGTFAWATSPWLLACFSRDAKEAGLTGIPALPSVNNVKHCAITSNSALKTAINGNVQKVVFEDLDLEPQGNLNQVAESWASYLSGKLYENDQDWKSLFSKKFCIIHDNVMSFLAKHATDIVTRVHINAYTGTAEEGQLWTEESLPSETVLSSLLYVQSVKGTNSKDVFDAVRVLTEGSIQLGGKATVGRGRCRLVLTGGAS